MEMTESGRNISLELDPLDRWNAFNRLQELSVPCHCACGKPLSVEVTTPTAALQVWSVVRRLTQGRQEAIEILENCWRQVVHYETDQ